MFPVNRPAWHVHLIKVNRFLYELLVDRSIFSPFRHFEFRLCPNAKAKQDCLDKHLLELLGGSPSVPQPNDLKTRFYPRNGSRIYEIKAKLPEGKRLISKLPNFSISEKFH